MDRRERLIAVFEDTQAYYTENRRLADAVQRSKAFIDRTYPIWQHLGKKEVYYIVSAGLGTDIIERSLGDLDGFVEHLEEPRVAGKLFAPNVMDRGLVKDTEVFRRAWDLGFAL